MELILMALGLLVIGAVVVPNTGESRILEIILKKTAPDDLDLKVFTNNITPAEGDTAATYTELAGGGYAGHAMVAANWTITEGAPTNGAYPQVVWTFTGAAGPAYGIYVVERTGGRLRWSDRFAGGPYSFTNNGDQLKVTPNFSAE